MSEIYFPEVKKSLGFGAMRLPMDGEKVDYTEFSKMIDYFIENGFNYFDTAHMYVGGLSETSLRDCLCKRYPRDKFILTNKLSTPYFETQEEIRPFFESQLELCGVDYFDFYLMHSQNQSIYEKFKRCKAYETALELKKEGKFRHFGISFHDKADVLDTILTEYPEIEAVQIQFNYLDFDDESIESFKCYEVCRKHSKPVIVMEPVKGGALVNLPQEAKRIFSDLNSGSDASFAIRFAAGFDGIFMVLSGMGNMQMIEDNVGYMGDFKKLSTEEMSAVEKVRAILKNQNLIKCTGCKYCIDGCPQNIPIPSIFSCMNNLKLMDESWNSRTYYNACTEKGGKASDCIGCGSCEEICPQHLPIRDLLKDVSKEFDK